MKIVEEYSNNNTELLTIGSAEYAGGYAIRLAFNDGSSRIIDFKLFLEASLHPSIRKYLDKNLFKQFKIIDGNLNWNDYDLIFPLFDLYKGNI